MTTSVLTRPEARTPGDDAAGAELGRRDPAWARPALLALLAATAVLYLWGLGASGYANDFYAAAVQAGTKSWKAFFFGSFDASNYITVDKPPASLWVMELSGRVFGFSSWSMLAPQAIEGVAAVALLYGAVRRVSGHVAGLVAGAVLALTPAAVLMFRFDNPDAFLTLLLTGSAYAVVRALKSGGTRWLLLAGSLIGLGFITKMGQALLVLPAFGLVYLLCGPRGIGRRAWQLLLAGVAVLVSAGWWVAIVELWPASSRPYIGGSTDNSILNLAFGYNGLGRLFGGSGNGGGGGGGAGGGGQGSSFGGATGLGRLFSSEMGQEISWLLPAALLAFGAGLWFTRRAPRTDLTRAALVMWGGWLLVTGLVFSYMQGTIHPYYTVALAPAIAGLVGTWGAISWQRRRDLAVRLTSAVMVAGTGLWSYVLLARNASWHPELRYLVLGAAALAALMLVAGPAWSRSRSMVVAGVAALAIVLGGAGATAFATASTTHSGSIPSVGSASSSAGGIGGGGGLGGGTGGRGGFGGGGASTSSDAALVKLLKASTTRWAAAASSSMTAGPLELSSGAAVMSIGGFNGSDSAITLAQFEALVRAGDIHYFIGGGSAGGGGGGGGAQGGNGVESEISTWVAAHYTAQTVGGTTIYDLTAAAR